MNAPIERRSKWSTIRSTGTGEPSDAASSRASTISVTVCMSASLPADVGDERDTGAAVHFAGSWGRGDLRRRARPCLSAAIWTFRAPPPSGSTAAARWCPAAAAASAWPAPAALAEAGAAGW